MFRPRSFFELASFTGAIFALSVGQVLAQEEDEASEEIPLVERQTLRVGPLTQDFTFDGRLSDPVWATADSIVNLVTIEPEEGGVPAGRTVVKVLADPNEIILALYCFDEDPGRIVSFSKARDSELEEEDHVLIVFDTFMDGRSGYVFAVNPSGARFDGLVVEQGEDVNGDWDTIWEAKTSRDDAGWYAELRIPIKSLGFKKDLTTWGFNVQRRVQRLQETSRWSGASLDYEIYQTSRAGVLQDLPDFDFGLGLSIRPSVVGRAGKPELGAPNEYDGDISLDLTQKLGPNLLAGVTVNTDFAETEVDVRQINLTRFDLFFPEKRSFFLEGADIFEFGVGLDEETLLPFFSRRIGLLGSGESDQAEIPINAGAKINGRVGNTNVGGLVVNTRNVDGLVLEEDVTLDVGQTTMGAVRISQNILEESTVGMMATMGDQQGRSGSWTAGADFKFQTSSFLGERNLSIGAWGLLNDREDLTGNKSAWGFRFDYPNDLLDFTLTSVSVGDGFEPSLGFVPRNDVHIWLFTGEFNPRPGASWLRQMFHEVALTLFNNHGNTEWESYAVTLKPFNWQFESGDRLEFSFEPEGDRPPEDFEVADEVIIPAGSYEWPRYEVSASSAQKRTVTTEIRWEWGDYYNGTLNTLEGTLALKPSAFLTIEFSGERNTGTALALEEGEPDLVEKDFTEELYGLRLQLNFSADLQISTLTQYDTQSGELGSNNKLRWTFHPLGEIFVVYNHNWERRDGRWNFVSNQLPVKVQYQWRF